MEKYSVLMAVYHKERGEFLRLAIESMLRQTVPPEEFVLVCDGPLTPALDTVIRSFCMQHPALFRVVRLEENVGLGLALNQGLQHCSCELVARMDSDDIALRDRMERQLQQMQEDPSLSAVGGQIAEFWEDPEQITAYRIVPCEEEKIRIFLHHRSPMNHTTVLARKSSILAAGGYPDIPGFEDYVLWAKLIAAGHRLRNIPEVCCKVRADAGMYCRRGGIPYFQNTLKMERFLRDRQLISSWEYCRNVALRFIGTVILTPEIRRWVFVHFLRKRNRQIQVQSRTYPSQLPWELAGRTYQKQ